MTPLDHQTILVTGATDGHGEGLAVELVRRGATVLGTYWLRRFANVVVAET